MRGKLSSKEAFKRVQLSAVVVEGGETEMKITSIEGNVPMQRA